LVDTYALNTQVAGIMYCVNLQRALFPSQVWEHFWDDVDPALNDDQPAVRRRPVAVHNHLLLRERGIDQFARWLARSREHGIEGWLTMRMNDCHGLEERERRYPGAPEGVMEWTSTFWRDHPEYRRAPYRWERSWEGAFDYGHRAVRDHHMALIRELCERYDMFGLELDWLRWGMHFAPGHEAAGRELLTDFVREVRELTEACAKRVGHPVRLGHRIPNHPEACLTLGYDILAWIREGLADQFVLSSHAGGAVFDYPLDVWRALVGPDVKLLTHASSVANAYPGSAVNSYEFYFGSASAALQRGADGIYLFNECYREGDDKVLLNKMLTTAGDPATLERVVRRYAVTYPAVCPPGSSERTILPMALRRPTHGANFARMDENITLRIMIGARPTTGRAVLRLGFSAGVPNSIRSAFTLRLNTHPVEPCDAPEWERVSQRLAERYQWVDDLPTTVAVAACWALPLAHLHDDVNVIEFVPPQIDGTLEWAEIVIDPQMTT